MNTPISKIGLHYFEKIILVLLGLILFLFEVELTADIESGSKLLIIGILLHLYLIIKSRKFKPLSIFFVFALSYQLNLIGYYKDGADISGGFSQFDRIDYYNATEYFHVIFIYSIALFFPLIREKIYFRDKILPVFSNFYFWITFIFMSFIAIFGLRGGSILDAGGYGKSELTSAGGTAIFEYFLVLTPLILIFSKHNTVLRILAVGVISFFVLKGLSFGIRNQILQLGLMLFCMYDSPKLKYWQIILVSLIPIYLLLIYGEIRANPLIVFSENFNEILLAPINNFGFNLLGNQNDIFYASVRIYGLLEQDIITAYDRLVITFSNLLAIVVPYSWLPEMANIAAYKQKQYGALGGTLISMYWYLFLGLPGVILIGSYISYIIKKFITSGNQYFIIYFLMVLTTYPRWLGYNQISLFKISIYGVLYLIVLKIIRHIILSSTNQSPILKKT